MKKIPTKAPVLNSISKAGGVLSGTQKKARPTVRPPLPEVHVDVALGDINDVRALVRMSASWVHEQVRLSKFPQPQRYGPRCTRWRIADIRQYLIERAALPQAEAAALAASRAKKASTKAAENRAVRAATSTDGQ